MQAGITMVIISKRLRNLSWYYRTLNSSLVKKHSWCCGTPEPRIFIARCRNWRKRIIIIYWCSRSIKYFHLPPWSVIGRDGRNQHAKFGYGALSTFRDMGLRIWKRFCVLQANGVSNRDPIWRGCLRSRVQSPVQIWCIYVEPFRRYWTEKFEK